VLKGSAANPSDPNQPPATPVKTVTPASNKSPKGQARAARKAASPVPRKVVATNAPTPVCSEDIENWLNSQDPPVAFEGCVTIMLGEINEEESQKNQARPEALDVETVDKYIQMIINGEKFPPLVVYRQAKRYVIIDGNHRYAAAKRRGVKSIEVYIVADDTSSDAIFLLTGAANVRHGKPVPTAWLQHLAAAALARGFTIEVVAKQFGLNKKQIADAQKIEKGRRRADRLGLVKLFNALNFTTQGYVSALTLDRPFDTMLRLLNDLPWRGAGLASFVTEVKKMSSENDQIDAIRQKRKELDASEKARKVKGRVNVNTLTDPIGQINSTLGKIMKGQYFQPDRFPRLYLTDQDRSEVMQRLYDAADRLLACVDALKNATPPSTVTNGNGKPPTPTPTNA